MADQSTKNLVEIADIQENIVLLKNGSLRSIIEVSALNFELRSEAEQVGIIQNFQNFLNSVDFPLQILVSSRKLVMTDYLAQLESLAATNQNELLKIQALEYSKFVKELLDLSNIMTKKFYVILPFYIFETPSKTGFLKSFQSAFRPSSVVQQINQDELDKYRAQLMQRVDLITDGLIGIGLKPRLLDENDLTNLFYGLYNPGEKYSEKTAPQ